MAKSHYELHLALDELLERYARNQLASIAVAVENPISKLCEWSAQQLDKPSSALPRRAVIAIEEITPVSPPRVYVEHGGDVDPTSPVGDMLGRLMDSARAA